VFDPRLKYTGRDYAPVMPSIAGHSAVRMILYAVLGASLLHAGDLSNYRGFKFGMTLADAAKQGNRKAADATTAHQQPALIQELEWQPGSGARTAQVKADPVRDGVLSFYNGELYRIVITYNPYQVAGMTREDMIQALTLSYGAASLPTTEIPYHDLYGEAAPVLARWEDSAYSYNLVQTGDHSTFALILYSKRLDSLAQAAIAESHGLEAQSAAQKELDEQKQRAQEQLLELEKARLVNIPNFRP
jgi:hypothetical protein